MSTRILVLNANPRVDSLNDQLADRYATGARNAGADVEQIALRDLDFDPVLHDGYTTPTQLEPDLVRFQEKLLACDHFTIMTPLWWNGTPAALKGLIDRALLPGFAVYYAKHALRPQPLLTGRSARIMITMNAPLIYQLTYGGDTAVRMLRRNVLVLSGFKPVNVTRFTPIRNAKPDRIRSYLTKAAHIGGVDGGRRVTAAQRNKRKPLTAGAPPIPM